MLTRTKSSSLQKLLTIYRSGNTILSSSSSFEVSARSRHGNAAALPARHGGVGSREPPDGWEDDDAARVDDVAVEADLAWAGAARCVSRD